MNHPHSPLFLHGGPADFDLLMPVTPTDPDNLNSGIAARFASGELIRLSFAFRDGNASTPPFEYTDNYLLVGLDRRPDRTMLG